MVKLHHPHKLRYVQVVRFSSLNHRFRKEVQSSSPSSSIVKLKHPYNQRYVKGVRFPNSVCSVVNLKKSLQSKNVQDTRKEGHQGSQGSIKQRRYYVPIANENSKPRGVHSLLYFAHTCVRDLFIGGGYLPCRKDYKVMVFYM
jgi:hypothetical protein